VTFGDRTEQAHGGGINGFNTYFVRYPAERLAVAVFANMNGPHADQIAKGLSRMFFGETVTLPVQSQ
jgi:CubicO group peptidase (beta-lactamase class C family)